MKFNILVFSIVIGLSLSVPGDGAAADDGWETRSLPEFYLLDQDGRAFDKENLKGKWTLMFFGYLSCPDICPTTLQILATVKRRLQGYRGVDRLQTVFVSVDPGRDTAEKLKQYVAYFDPDFIAASGEQAQLKRLSKALNVSYYLNPDPSHPESYEVAHSDHIALINPLAEFYGSFVAPHEVDVIADELIRIMGLSKSE